MNLMKNFIEYYLLQKENYLKKYFSVNECFRECSLYIMELIK